MARNSLQLIIDDVRRQKRLDLKLHKSIDSDIKQYEKARELVLSLLKEKTGLEQKEVILKVLMAQCKDLSQTTQYISVLIAFLALICSIISIILSVNDLPFWLFFILAICLVILFWIVWKPSCKSISRLLENAYMETILQDLLEEMKDNSITPMIDEKAGLEMSLFSSSLSDKQQVPIENGIEEHQKDRINEGSKKDVADIESED